MTGSMAGLIMGSMAGLIIKTIHNGGAAYPLGHLIEHRCLVEHVFRLLLTASDDTPIPA